MCGSIAFYMAVVSVLRYQRLKLCSNILYHIRVGMLIHCNPGGGMWYGNIANATLNTTRLDHIPNL
jgi:hypothetical protein